MPTQHDLPDEDPGIDGPDYVALVIEWDELAGDLEQQLQADEASLLARPQQKRSWRNRAIGAAAVIGLFGVLLLARRLHH